VQEDSGTVLVISGAYGKAQGAAQGDHVQILLLDVSLKPNPEWRLPVDSMSTLFIYIVEGGGLFEASTTTRVKSHRAVLFGEGDEFAVQAEREGIRFALFTGRPLREPIAWGGPIMLNTREELQQALADMDHRTFIRTTKTGDAL
jgi:quercetin 2,3-dioxygenase